MWRSSLENGQDYTISSSVSVGLTTDTFTVTTPTNFLNTSSVNATKITALQFDLGNANSGVTFGGVADPVNLLLPTASATGTGNILYGTANTNFALSPTVTLAAGGGSYSAVEGVNYGTSAISALAVHSFSMTVTYANPVPEPSAFAALGLGAVGLLCRRKRA